MTTQGVQRTSGQLRQHYETEKELAARLRSSSREERVSLYGTLYEELFRRVSLHPQLTRGQTDNTVALLVATKMRLLRRFLGPTKVFLELGAGDCQLALAAAGYVGQAYALDVTPDVMKGLQGPANFEFILSGGTDIPLPPSSVNVAYSYQLMEHIHPDDAHDQLSNLYTTLAPGGVYVCITPNRLSGPHDISRYFDPVATGFHLREYTITEVARLFRIAGFKSVLSYPGIRGCFWSMPIPPVSGLELAIDTLPPGLKRAVASAPLVRNVLLAAVIGIK